MASQSTLPARHDERSLLVDRVLRVLLGAVLVAVLLLGAGGRLGVATEVASVTGGGLDLSVRYASVTRPGLSSPFVVTLAGAALPPTIVVEVDTDYVMAFDLNALHPQPASGWSDGDRERWTFELPAGATEFSVSADARLDPSVQSSLAADVAVESPEGQGLTVSLHTRVLP